MAPVPLVQQQSNNPNREWPVARRVVVSEPGAVAMGSNTQVEFMIGSHPPPHAGCSRGDPGPLAVLTQRCGLTTRWGCCESHLNYQPPAIAPTT